MGNLPAAVQRQAEAGRAAIEADRIMPEEGGDTGTETDGAETTTNDASQAPPAQQQAYVPQPIELDQSSSSSVPGEPGTAAAPQAAAEAGDYAQLADEYRRLKAAHSTLEGKYRAEMRGDVRALYDHIENLEKKLAAAEAALPATETPQQRNPDADTDAELDSIRRRLGEDLGDTTLVPQIETLMQRLIQKGGSASQLNELEKMRADLRRAEGVAEKATMAVFVQQLAGLVPDWEQINLDPNFMVFLSQLDPASGQTYHALMLNARDDGDARRVAHFFNGFKEQRVAHSGGSQHQITNLPQPSQGPSTGVVDPSLTGGEDPATKIWANSAVDELLSHKTTRNWKGDLEQLKEMQTQARLAVAQGRIDYTR